MKKKAVRQKHKALDLVGARLRGKKSVSETKTLVLPEEPALGLIPAVGSEKCSVFTSGPVWNERWEEDLIRHRLWNRIADAPFPEYSTVAGLYAGLSAPERDPERLQLAKQAVCDLVVEAVQNLDPRRIQRIKKTIELIRDGFLGKTEMGPCEKLWEEARFLTLQKKELPTKLELRKRIDPTGVGDVSAFSRKLKKAGLQGLADSHATKGRISKGRKRASSRA
jgi:hypothetical protein